MAWFKVDDGFHSSRKLLKIPRSHRLTAAGAWVISGTWSAQEELDGFVPDYMLDEWGITPEIVAWLVVSELWQESSEGSQFTNWGQYQPTRAELEEGRRKERERKAAWRTAKAARTQNNGANQSQRDTSVTDGYVPSYPTRPDPARPDPTPSVSKDTSGGGDAAEPPPSKSCKKHPHWDHDEACRPCSKDRKAYEEAAEQAEQESRRTARRTPQFCEHGIPAYEACERCGPSWPGR